jgi:uncharacterized membrane protein YgaE (UPF0421/DUF939 family)
MLSRAAAVESIKQAIKTAVAGLISLNVTNIFHLPEGYWAAITALIVMQSNVGATLSASRTRLAGTAVGALVGGLFAAEWGFNMLAFAVAVTIAFFLCDLLHLPDSQRLATVTVAIIILIGHTTSAWIIAVHRFSEVALGILIALLVSLTLWPNHARRTVRKELGTALMKSRVFYQAVMQSYLRRGAAGNSSDSLENLRAQVTEALRKNAELLKNALQEAFGSMKERESVSLLSNQVERIFMAVETVEFSIRDSSQDTYFLNFQAGLDHLGTGVSEALDSLSESIASAGKVSSEWPDLAALIASLDEQAAQARKAGAIQNYSLDDVLRFYFLLLSSRTLVAELDRARTLIEARWPANRKAETRSPTADPLSRFHTG